MALLRSSNWLARRLVLTSARPIERAVARNKLVTQAAISALCGVRTPRVLGVFEDRQELMLSWLDGLPPRFVVKSAVSSTGRQVCVLERRADGCYVEPDGLVWPRGDLEPRLWRMPQPVFAEEIARAHPQLVGLAAHGTLCDLRFHFVGDELIVGRCRIPTARSRGYGNTGRGALGVCFRPDGRLDCDHPYVRVRAPAEVDGERLDGLELACFASALAEARQVARLFASPHVGVDGTIDPDGRLLVIEVTLVPDTKWMSARATLAFRDALRRAPAKPGGVERWLATRPDLGVRVAETPEPAEELGEMERVEASLG